MQLEALCKNIGNIIHLPLYKDVDGLWRMDWEPLISYIQDESVTIQQRAEAFHTSMAHAILTQVLQLREQYNVSQVGLTGGVFQNRVLTEQVVALLEKHGFAIYLTENVPCNDAGICFGQLIEYGALLNA